MTDKPVIRIPVLNDGTLMPKLLSHRPTKPVLIPKAACNSGCAAQGAQ